MLLRRHRKLREAAQLKESAEEVKPVKAKTTKASTKKADDK